MPITPKIVLDLAGADLGEEELLRGTRLAFGDANGAFDVVLASNHPERTQELVDVIIPKPPKRNSLRILNAAHKLPEKIASPVHAYKDYPESTINVGMREIIGNPNAAFISTGNTGIVMSSALFTLSRIKGVSRPPIASPLPTLGRTCFLLDAGSNVDNRPKHLHEFARIGSVYANQVWDRESPTVALLSNGEEEYKGNALVRETHALLRADSSLNYVGLREGNTIFDGDLDVIVCDGFVGNVVLKFVEGMAVAITKFLKYEIGKRPLAGLSAKLFLGAAFKALRKRIDYSEYGGAPLLGVNGNAVICHGRSDANAIKNAIKEAIRLAKTQCWVRIQEAFDANAGVQK